MASLIEKKFNWTTEQPQNFDKNWDRSSTLITPHPPEPEPIQKFPAKKYAKLVWSVLIAHSNILQPIRAIKIKGCGLNQR